ncbi:MAG TPA: hypothetical protein VIC54_00780 [Terriglobales bacterium]
MASPLLLGALVLLTGNWQLATGNSAASASGFYRLATSTGPARLLAPGGEPMPLLAADHIHLISPSAPRTDLAPDYVDRRSQAILAGLRAWGFNALGGDTDADVWHRGLPFIESLGISAHLQANQQTALFDVYAPDFPAQVAALAQAACAPEAGDSQLIGYLSDEGLTWDPAPHAALVLSYYLQLPQGAPGRERAEDYVRIRYHSDIRRLDQAWGEAAKDFIALTVPAANTRQFAAFAADAAPFAQQVLVRYLQVVANAIHAADPNHLYLGAGLDPGADGLAWTVPDVDSVRLSPAADPGPIITALPRPALAMETGCGAVSVATQAMFSLPTLVGYVWIPAGDWQSGACAAQAAGAWAGVNRQARRQ